MDFPITTDVFNQRLVVVEHKCPPDPPQNCSIANQTTDAIEVLCGKGFDGGLPQLFHMEVYESQSGRLYRNLSSPSPVFRMTSMQPGLPFTMHAYAANNKGRSAVAQLETFTLKVAEKRTGPPSFIEFTPVLGILVGIFLAIILTVIIIMLIMKIRRPVDPNRALNIAMPLEPEKDVDNRSMNHPALLPVSSKDHSGGMVRTSGGSNSGGGSVNGSGGGGSNSLEERGGGCVRGVSNASGLGSVLATGVEGLEDSKNPDVVPQKTDQLSYSSYSSLERGARRGSGDLLPTSRGFEASPLTALEAYGGIRSLQRQRNFLFKVACSNEAVEVVSQGASTGGPCYNLQLFQESYAQQTSRPRFMGAILTFML
ncbi:Fibronectin type III [Trinorchestia longiramus]|nr:Fibronectin type III [Trinorchestia longiramus]